MTTTRPFNGSHVYTIVVRRVRLEKNEERKKCVCVREREEKEIVSVCVCKKKIQNVR